MVKHVDSITTDLKFWTTQNFSVSSSIVMLDNSRNTDQGSPVPGLSRVVEGVSHELPCVEVEGEGQIGYEQHLWYKTWCLKLGHCPCHWRIQKAGPVWLTPTWQLVPPSTLDAPDQCCRLVAWDLQHFVEAWHFQLRKHHWIPLGKIASRGNACFVQIDNANHAKSCNMFELTSAKLIK